MDNVFVMALIFGLLRRSASQQHRVLFWGIVGALVMRGIMIGIGGALISTFHWVLYIFGGFLVFTGIRMAMPNEQGVDPEKNVVIRLAKKFFPSLTNFDGQKFITRINGAVPSLRSRLYC